MRDSPLTNHGFQQATRLGQFLNIRGVDFTHIFASPLQRAYTTAEQIRKGQSGPNRDGLTVIPMPSLQEQDFGLFEGCPYQDYREEDTRAVTVESFEAMSRRADVFIDECIMPLLNSQGTPIVAVVSHGKLLQTLWSQALSRIKPATVVCDQQLLTRAQSLDYRRISWWSNTGYIEAAFSRSIGATQPSRTASTQSLSGPVPHTASGSGEMDSESIQPDGTETEIIRSAFGPWTAVISAINGQDHLDGLSRARGGLGSARYDSRQGTLDKFVARGRPG